MEKQWVNQFDLLKNLLWNERIKVEKNRSLLYIILNTGLIVYHFEYWINEFDTLIETKEAFKNF